MKMLGLLWNKKDMLSVKIPTKEVANTKRGLLQHLASIYDLLGTISPVTLVGKTIFRDVCEAKVAWDTIAKRVTETMDSISTIRSKNSTVNNATPGKCRLC